MRVQSLLLRDFRNIHRLSVEFHPGINVIYGHNAQGKTNLLEAIYLLVTGRSFRTTQDSELIPWATKEYEGTLIRAEVIKQSGQEQLTFFLLGKTKQILVNGTPIARMANLIGRLNAVLFTPADLLLVRGAPALRRRFLDIAIGQSNPIYLHALQQYQHVLKNRNTLLKQITLRGAGAETPQLDVYDEQLADTAEILIQQRARAIGEMSEFATGHYHAIASESEPLTLAYQPDISPDAELPLKDVILRDLRAARTEDLRKLSTNRGPHRDDFHFIIQKYHARTYASQGQQRTAVLAAKLAEMDYLRLHTRETPLLMLDDLMSELDHNRKTALIHHLKADMQIFITTTDRHTIEDLTAPQKFFKMTHGHLEPVP